MKNLVLSFILILIIIFIGLSLFNKTILRSNSPGFLKAIVTLMIPPSDLYEYLAVENVKDNNSMIVLRFKHNYVGSHSIDLLLLNEDRSIRYLNDKKITGIVKCSLGENTKINKNIIKSQPFIWKNGTGVTLLSYNVPEKLPLNGEIVCEVSFSNFDHSLSDMNAMLVINKNSDL